MNEPICLVEQASAGFATAKMECGLCGRMDARMCPRQDIASKLAIAKRERDQLRAELAEANQRIAELKRRQVPDGWVLADARVLEELIRRQAAEIERLRDDTRRLDWVIDNFDVADGSGDDFLVWLDFNYFAGSTPWEAIDHAMRDGDEVRDRGTPYQQVADALEADGARPTREQIADQLREDNARLTGEIERLRSAASAALDWIDNHGEPVFQAGGWPVIESMNVVGRRLRALVGGQTEGGGNG